MTATWIQPASNKFLTQTLIDILKHFSQTQLKSDDPMDYSTANISIAGRQQKCDVIPQAAGLQRHACASESPKALFYLLISSDMIELIIRHTNQCITRKLACCLSIKEVHSCMKLTQVKFTLRLVYCISAEDLVTQTFLLS